MKEKLNEEIDFVARHYDSDAFDVKAGMRRLGIRRFSIARRIAAAVAGVVVLTAAASIVYYVNHENGTSPVPTETVIPPTAPSATAQSKTIDLDNATLPEIVSKLEATYGVEIENVPDGDYRLTIHYEGTAEDALETINSLLGTEMTIKP